MVCLIVQSNESASAENSFEIAPIARMGIFFIADENNP
jgi:hypothetical protein